MWRAPCDFTTSVPLTFDSDHHSSAAVDHGDVTFRFAKGDVVERLLERFAEYEHIPRRVRSMMAHHIHQAMDIACTSPTTTAASPSPSLVSQPTSVEALAAQWAAWYNTTTTFASSSTVATATAASSLDNGYMSDDSDTKRGAANGGSSSRDVTPPQTPLRGPSSSSVGASPARRRVIPLTLSPSIKSVYQTRDEWRRWSRAFTSVCNGRPEYRTTLWHLERTFATEVLTNLTLREREFDALQMKQGLEMQHALESPPVVSSGSSNTTTTNEDADEEMQQRASSLVHRHMAARRALELQWDDTLKQQRLRQITDYRRHVTTLYDHDTEAANAATATSATADTTTGVNPLGRSSSSSSLNGKDTTNSASATTVTSTVPCITTQPSSWSKATAAPLPPLLPASAIDIIPPRHVWLGSGTRRSMFTVRLIMGDVMDNCASRHYTDTEMDLCMRRSMTLYSDAISGMVLPCDLDSLTDMGFDMELATATVAARRARQRANNGIDHNEAETSDDDDDCGDHDSEHSAASATNTVATTIDGSLSQAWPRCRELARACRSTELHFPTYRQQLASCARRLVTHGLRATTTASSNANQHTTTTATIQQPTTITSPTLTLATVSTTVASSDLALDDDDHDTGASSVLTLTDDDLLNPSSTTASGGASVDDHSLHAGDIVMTRHSNLLSAHMVMYLICDTTIPSEPSADASLDGLSRLVIAADRYGLGWLSIPLLLWPQHMTLAFNSLRTTAATTTSTNSNTTIKPLPSDIKVHMEAVMRAVKSGLSSIAARARTGSNCTIHEVRLMVPSLSSSSVPLDAPLIAAARTAFANVF